MKAKLFSTLLCASALMAGTALAQRDSTTQPGSTQPGGTYQPSSPSGRDFGHSMMHGQDIRSSKIQGAQIKSATGEILGTIEDVILNPRTGRAEFAVLSVTGPTGTTPTGAGEKLTPIPWRLLNFNSTGGAGAEQYSFTANVDQTKLNAAPTFDKNQWPDMSSHDWAQKYYSYYGISPGSSGGTGWGSEKGGFGSDKDQNKDLNKDSGFGGSKSDTTK